MAKMETAYLAGGCFWCITPTFKEMEGVTDVVSGYSGGDEVNPAYKDVKEQKTGHRETIRIDFDADTADFEEIFDIFLSSIDPYDAEGQFIDKGFSYTLAVYYTNENQKTIAEKALLSDREKEISIQAAKNTEHIELSTNMDFQEFFISAMSF